MPHFLSLSNRPFDRTFSEVVRHEHYPFYQPRPAIADELLRLLRLNPAADLPEGFGIESFDLAETDPLYPHFTLHVDDLKENNYADSETDPKMYPHYADRVDLYWDALFKEGWILDKRPDIDHRIFGIVLVTSLPRPHFGVSVSICGIAGRQVSERICDLIEPDIRSRLDRGSTFCVFSGRYSPPLAPGESQNHDLPDDVFAALEKSVDALEERILYIEPSVRTKAIENLGLLANSRAIRRVGTLPPGAKVELVGILPDTPHPRIRAGTWECPLTPGQYEVLKILAEKRGSRVTYNELVEASRNTGYPKLITLLVKEIPEPNLIIKIPNGVRGAGYRLLPEVPSVPLVEK